MPADKSKCLDCPSYVPEYGGCAVIGNDCPYERKSVLPANDLNSLVLTDEAIETILVRSVDNEGILNPSGPKELARAQLARAVVELEEQGAFVGWHSRICGVGRFITCRYRKDCRVPKGEDDWQRVKCEHSRCDTDCPACALLKQARVVLGGER